MKRTDRRQASIGLLRDYMAGRIDRRQLLKSAAAAGVLLPVLSIMRGASPAFAQDASPAAGGEAGSTIVVPADLRTDLAGATIAWMGTSSQDADLPFNEAAIAKFTEATGINVNLINGESETNLRLQAMRQQFAAQSSDIDVYQIDIIWPGVVAEHAVPLQDQLGAATDAMFPGIVEANTVDGDLIGIPWYTDAGLLFYRTDLLEKYGVEAPTTWSELEAAAQTIMEGEQAENPDFTGYVWQGKAYEGLTCNGLEWLVSQGGGTIIDVDRNVTVNNETAIAAMDRAATWVNGISPEGVTTYTEPETFNVWTAGNAAFARNWPYMYSASQESEATAGKVGVSPLPKGDGAEDTSAATLGGWQMFVSKYSENQEAAIEFVRFMTSPEYQTSYAIERAHLPTIPAVYDDPAVAAASEFIPQLKPVFEAAVGRPSAQTGDLYPEISTVFYQQLNQVLSGSKSAADAAASMESDMNAIFEDE
ncbi:MAG: ABC transporter substrate-binding protein [Thermomicrobiales bacterium]|nr:ABC transporter substrate-binding protein [Thermomicrobiales bacterium]MCO5221894.1 ABC transporter substrate-binding protein [Thermomicrobiales bacterium]